MPRRAKGARLWLQPARRDGSGRIVERAVWCIRDGNHKFSTGFGEGEAAEAERALAEYIAGKYSAPRIGKRDPAAVNVADIIAIYADDAVSAHARPKETSARLGKILDFFGDKRLSDVTKSSCSEYVRWRGYQAAARRELEDLRAAIRHHWKAGLCAALTPVVLPDPGASRERWLTRSEAARLLWAAYRYREVQKGWPTGRHSRRHIARFILVALYTGTRAGAICGAALTSAVGRGWVDLDNGIFYRRAAGKSETKKRQPTIRIPPRLLAHMRRWKRLGLSTNSVVEWNGKPVKKINKAFRGVRAVAGLGPDVVPHVLRHTAITWTAQRGVPKHQICGFFGITEEMFNRVYGHHHPEHQEEAVNALSGPRQKPDSFAATKRERTSSNVTKISEKSRHAR
jgi:integrase